MPDRDQGQEKAEEFASEDEAGTALEAFAQEKRRQGYRDLCVRTR
nr:WGR domain-containing protein [Microvirga ossetica]